MADILATGPMKIPGKVTGDPAGGPPDIVNVSIKNPTNQVFKIQLFAEVCFLNKETGVGLREELFPDEVFVIPPDTCRNRTFGFLFVPGVEVADILRFFAKGDLDEAGGKLELSFAGQRASDEMNEPTMFFRHSDLIEVEEDYFKKYTNGSASGTLPTNFWRKR